ncbi:hypothetical protein GQ42DRAFT_161006 [Ramicandelaber brevisporus]|nr:hypothetical protein GQ42DRAFT_161006 [Ramicandelaber brevisporus]
MYSLCSRIGIDGQQSGGSITGPKVLYANHGAGSPYIGEFAFGYDDGASLFSSRPTITVTGNGASVPQPPVTPPVTPTTPPTKPPTTPTPTQTQTTPTFTPTRIPNNNSKSSAAPVPTSPPTTQPQPPSGACAENATKCSGSGRDLYAQCLFGAWINRPCAPGTVCKDVAGGFVCDFP